MKWESLSLHIENLLPGLVTLPLLVESLPEESRFRLMEIGELWATSSEVLKIGIVLAMAYLVGIVAVIVSRAVIDYLSSVGPRPFLLRRSRRPLSGTRKSVNEQYDAALGEALARGNDRIATEVLKRRERARLVRTCFVPVVLATWIFSGSRLTVGSAIFELAAILGVLLLYAYVEMTIYQEATLAK